MVAFESFGIVSYLHSRVIMAKSCICEIKRDIGRKSRFSYTHCIRRPRYGGGGPRRNITITFGTEKLEWCGYPTVKKNDDLFSRFDTIPACDRRTGNLATA